MHVLRTAATALAVLALAGSPDALAKKGHGKGRGKGGPPHAIKHGRKHLERDLAALIAARPRLPDGSRVVLRAPPPPSPTRRLRATPTGAAALPAPVPIGSDPLTAQRRVAAVDAYLRSHRPLP